MSATVEVEDLRVSFEKRGAEPVVALDRMSLDIPPGDFISVVGPSGCGKTTLLRSLAALQVPTEGAIRVDGSLLTGPRTETCLMFQAPTLLPWLTIVENVLLPTKLRRKVTRDDRQAALDLLERAGLADFEKSYPHELSGGMQQRAALCRALAAKPSLLLLDEPFGALDAMTREQMNFDLHRMWKRDAVTTLLITHSIPEAVLLARRVVVMSARPGRVVDVVEVPLPEDRDPGVMASEEFTATCARIRKHFTQGASHVDH